MVYTKAHTYCVLTCNLLLPPPHCSRSPASSGSLWVRGSELVLDGPVTALCFDASMQEAVAATASSTVCGKEQGQRQQGGVRGLGGVCQQRGGWDREDGVG